MLNRTAEKDNVTLEFLHCFLHVNFPAILRHFCTVKHLGEPSAYRLREHSFTVISLGRHRTCRESLLSPRPLSILTWVEATSPFMLCVADLGRGGSGARPLYVNTKTAGFSFAQILKLFLESPSPALVSRAGQTPAFSFLITNRLCLSMHRHPRCRHYSYHLQELGLWYME